MSELEETHKIQATKPGSLLIAVLGAIGGALLALGGQVALEWFKSDRADQREKSNQVRADEREAAQGEAARSLERFNRAQRLHNEYVGYGDRARRASVFADGGREGGVAEVRTIAGHFHRLSVEIASRRVDKHTIDSLYGGRLWGWSRRFRSLAGDGAHADRFDAGERELFGLLGAALAEFAPTPPIDDPFAAVAASSNTASNASGY